MPCEKKPSRQIEHDRSRGLQLFFLPKQKILKQSKKGLKEDKEATLPAAARAKSATAAAALHALQVRLWYVVGQSKKIDRYCCKIKRFLELSVVDTFLLLPLLLSDFGRLPK